MRSGLNGRGINRLAVNATYREIVHAEATAEIVLAILIEPSVLPIISTEAALAVIDLEAMVSPLATPAIPAEYAAPPGHRSLSMGRRESMAVEAERREL